MIQLIQTVVTKQSFHLALHCSFISCKVRECLCAKWGLSHI